MAKRLNRMRRFCDRIPDWIWPHLTGDAEPQPQNLDYFSAKQAHLLDHVERILASRLAKVEERVQSVESKLMSLFTLTSVLSAAFIAGLAASSVLGAAEEAIKIVAVFFVLYVVLQLWFLLRATLAGLERKSYKELSPEDIVPRDGEACDAYRVRLLNLQVNYMLLNEWVGNQKVSKMAVAHEASKNALHAIFILIVLAGLNFLRIMASSLALCAGVDG